MKKNLYIANLLVAGLMTFTGCTDGFESDNANKAGYTPELQEYDRLDGNTDAKDNGSL